MRNDATTCSPRCRARVWQQVGVFLAGFALLALPLAGCSKSNGSSSSADQNASRSTVVSEETVRETKAILAAYGPTEDVEPAEIIGRDVTIKTDRGEFQIEGSVATYGSAGVARPDPRTGELLWRAGTCINPDCHNSTADGRPFLFVHPFGSDKVSAEGKLLEDTKELVLCPKCGRSDTIREYFLPGVVERRAQLDQELLAARMAYDAKKFRGTPLPPGTRTPNEINRERALLPRFYLPESVNQL